MGCWDETDGFTGLPIRRGDKALLFLLAPGGYDSDGRSGFCYPTGLWTPFILPFRGVYADYGTIGIVGAPPTHWSVSKALLDDLDLLSLDRSEQSKPLQALYDEKFFEAIERGWVSGRSRFGVYGHRHPDHRFPVGQMLVREDVWEALLNIEYRPGWCETVRSQNQSDAREFLAYLQGLPSNMIDVFEIQSRFEQRSSSFFHALFAPGEGLSLGRYRQEIIIGILERKIAPEVFLPILYDIADVAHVNMVLHGLRRAWQPQTGKGSQDSDWDLHEAFALQVAEIAGRAREAEEE